MVNEATSLFSEQNFWDFAAPPRATACLPAGPPVEETPSLFSQRSAWDFAAGTRGHARLSAGPPAEETASLFSQRNSWDFATSGYPAQLGSPAEETEEGRSFLYAMRKLPAEAEVEALRWVDVDRLTPTELRGWYNRLWCGSCTTFTKVARINCGNFREFLYCRRGKGHDKNSVAVRKFLKELQTLNLRRC